MPGNFFLSFFKVVMALRCGADINGNLYTGINTKHIYLTSKMVLYLKLVLLLFLLPFKMHLLIVPFI